MTALLPPLLSPLELARDLPRALHATTRLERTNDDGFRRALRSHEPSPRSAPEPRDTESRPGKAETHEAEPRERSSRADDADRPRRSADEEYEPEVAGSEPAPRDGTSRETDAGSNAGGEGAEIAPATAQGTAGDAQTLPVSDAESGRPAPAPATITLPVDLPAGGVAAPATGEPAAASETTTSTTAADTTAATATTVVTDAVTDGGAVIETSHGALAANAAVASTAAVTPEATTGADAPGSPTPGDGATVTAALTISQNAADAAAAATAHAEQIAPTTETTTNPTRAESIAATTLGGPEEPVSSTRPAAADTGRTPQRVAPVAATSSGPSGPTTPTAGDAPAPTAVDTLAAALRQSALGGDSGGQRSSDQPSSHADSSATLTPAAARAAQVEASVQLERLLSPTAAPGTVGGSTPSLAPGAPALAAVAGGLEADNVARLLAEADDVDEQALTARVTRGLGAMINQRGGTMTMRLHPAELGELRVQMTIAQGTVAAQFIATSAHAQMLLDRNLGVLRTSLESHGLTVERLGVQLAASDASGGPRTDGGDQQQGQPQHRGDHDAGGSESRGRRHGQGTSTSARREAPADFAADLGAHVATAEDDRRTDALQGATP